MVTYADSSFLVSVYIDDSHTETARAYFSRNPEPIVLTNFSRSEAQHALRVQAFQKRISVAEMTRALLQFERDESEDFFRSEISQEDKLFPQAIHLSRRYALEYGVRYLDLLHLAAAQLVRADRFLTFDASQGKLAKNLGFQVRP